MIIGWGLMPDQIIEVNPHFEEQMTDQLNKLPLLKLEYKFLDAYLINTYKGYIIF